MKRFFIVIVLMLTSGSAMAGVNWFVVATSDFRKKYSRGGVWVE